MTNTNKKTISPSEAARILSSCANPKNKVRGDSAYYSKLAALRRNPGRKPKAAA